MSTEKSTTQLNQEHTAKSGKLSRAILDWVDSDCKPDTAQGLEKAYTPSKVAFEDLGSRIMNVPGLQLTNLTGFRSYQEEKKYLDTEYSNDNPSDIEQVVKEFGNSVTVLKDEVDNFQDHFVNDATKTEAKGAAQKQCATVGAYYSKFEDVFEVNGVAV
ncbi:hypothetical protein P7C73_g130, partial [Tremellales sp. Uapishka_1]